MQAVAEAAPTVLKPPLKWAGGKRWLVGEIVPLWMPHAHRRYVEPFVGGMALPLGLRPRHAVLNDNNSHVIAFYQWLQRGLRIDAPMHNDREFFYARRDEFNDLIRAGQTHSQRAAELFYYLNRTGFNGLCRFNRRGEFNVPFGKYKTINYTTDFNEFQPALADWQFTDGDFESMTLDAGDFIYADPPYDVEFTQYSRYGFSWDDQVRLAEWLAKHRGPVVVSNQATSRIITLYEKLGFKTKCLPAPRRIACNGDRQPALEVIGTRNIG